MTVTLELSPDEEQRFQERAAQLGQDVIAYIRRLIREDLEGESSVKRRTFAEILAPVHDDFRESGMTEGELDTLLGEALQESRTERREGEDQGSMIVRAATGQFEVRLHR